MATTTSPPATWTTGSEMPKKVEHRGAYYIDNKKKDDCGDSDLAAQTVISLRRRGADRPKNTRREANRVDHAEVER